MAARILPAYEALLGVPYPLSKLDLVGIPDFSAGAMENWGILFFRETDLLLPPAAPALENERAVALTVAHEMAHLVSHNTSACPSLSYLQPSLHVLQWQMLGWGSTDFRKESPDVDFLKSRTISSASWQVQHN